jgi:hypothetical protein
MLPGTWRSADPLIPRQGEDPHAVVAGVTRPHLSLVQRAPRGPVRSAGMLMPKAARERFTTPPAGTALAPLPRRVSGAGPLLSEIRNVTVLVTFVNGKVTIPSNRHCEEKSDEAIQLPGTELDYFAALVMAKEVQSVARHYLSPWNMAKLESTMLQVILTLNLLTLAR